MKTKIRIISILLPPMLASCVGAFGLAELTRPAEEEQNMIVLPGGKTVAASETPANGIGTLPVPSGAAHSVQEIVNDETPGRDFAFQTMHSTTVNVLLGGEAGPLTGLVEISDVAPAGERATVRFRGVTDDDGRLQGSISYPTATEELRLTLLTDGLLYTFPVQTRDLTAIVREYRVSSSARATGGNFAVSENNLTDGDSDGTPDLVDDFPEDPTRSTRVQHPPRGRFTIAYEDLYPRQGDADFNDYVIQARMEEHLDSSGNIVQVKGSYLHVARAAGYRHQLRVKLPEALAAANYSVTRIPYTGAASTTESGRVAGDRVVEISERSDRTIGARNADRGQEFSAGDLFELEITPDAPARHAGQGLPPYDLFIYVYNTRREVHFPGLYFDSEGNDEYLDPAGFPWALAVPVDWRWMYERQNIHQAYLAFQDWYTSQGASSPDWYNFPELDKVFENVTTHYSMAPVDDGRATVSQELAPVPVRTQACFLPIGHSYSVQLNAGQSGVRLEYPFARAKMEDVGFPLEFEVFRLEADGTYTGGFDVSIVDGSDIVRADVDASGSYVLAASSRVLDGEEACPEAGPPGLYVNKVTGSDTNPGTPAEPVATIERALELVSEGNIFVAAGKYTLTTPIVIRSNISLFGGYNDADWNDRDITLHKTTLFYDTGFSTGPPLATVQYYDGTDAALTKLSGFEIMNVAYTIYAREAGVTVEDCTIGAYLDRGSSYWSGFTAITATDVILERNTFTLPDRNNNIEAIVISGNSGNSVILRGNRVEGGIVQWGVLTGVAITPSNLNQAIIEDNTIIMGQAWTGTQAFTYGAASPSVDFHRNRIIDGSERTAVQNFQSTAVRLSHTPQRGPMFLRATDNYIQAGPGNRTTALNVFTTDGILERNVIDAGGRADAIDTVGIWNLSETLTIANNIVRGGVGTTSTALRSSIAYTSTPAASRVYNNTLIGRNTPGTGAQTGYGVRLDDGATPDLQNNLIHCPAGDAARSICIGESRSTSQLPAAARNNALSGCDVAYLDFHFGCMYGDECMLNELNGFGPNFGGNVSATPAFTDEDGADNDLATVEDNDYSLSAGTPVTVRAGGLDLSSFFTGDFASTLRTTPWSIGAFERD